MSLQNFPPPQHVSDHIVLGAVGLCGLAAHKGVRATLAHPKHHLSCEAFLAFAQLEFAGAAAELKHQVPKVGLRQKQPS